MPELALSSKRPRLSPGFVAPADVPIIRWPVELKPLKSSVDRSRVSNARYIGKSFKRIEDIPLLRGRGRFVDDLQFPGHAACGVRAQPACARADPRHRHERGDARAGVHAVLTLADISPQLSQERLPLQFRTAQLPPDITPFVLAKDEVAFVGEAVAVVIAEHALSRRGRRRAASRSTTSRCRRYRIAGRRSRLARRLPTAAARAT